jgi:hypothetical protein
MRTRRSPKNQDRLWRAIGRELAKQAMGTRPVDAPPLTDDEIDAMWWMSKTSRNLMKRDAAAARRGATATDVPTVNRENER